MIEPPRQFRRARIFEIDDCVFIAIKDAVLERLGRLVGHSRVEKLHVRLDPFAIKAGKYRGGGSAVETFVMKTYTNLQRFLSIHRGSNRKTRKGKSTNMAGPSALVNSEPGFGLPSSPPSMLSRTKVS